jgi:RNA polymerase sigma factor for flagellar operon FliA
VILVASGPGSDVVASKRPKEVFILQHLPLVRSIARLMSVSMSPAIEHDELVNYGVIGLIKAATRFDSLRGVRFEVYAATVIRGAILDGLRSTDVLSQYFRRKAKKVSRIIAGLAEELGRAPSDEEIAARLGLSLEGYYELAAKIEPAVHVPLDSLLDRDAGSLVVFVRSRGQDQPDIVAERRELRYLLLEAVGRLPSREKRVISLHYYSGLTVNRIAGLMGVSHARVSQIHRRALTRLNLLLDKYRPDFVGM